MAQHSYKAHLECIECGAEYDILSVRYRCDACGGLIDVRHDTEALKNRSASEWKMTFQERFRSAEFPFDSGIWGKKEWVLPEIQDEHIVSLGEGGTPLVPAYRLAEELGLRDLRIKQSGISHTGSFKDLGMTVLVSHVNSLRAAGLPIRAVAAASSGDTSAALAAYAAAAGVPSIVFLPAGKISTAQLVQPLSSGSLVLALDTDFDGCMKIVKEVTAKEGIYLANSMNPLRIEGQKTISIEIVQQLGWEIPDWIVIPGGNLGNVSALVAGFRMMEAVGLIDRRPGILLAQAENANPYVRSFRSGYKTYEAVQAKTTLASAIQIGDPVSYPRAIRAMKDFAGIAEDASESELAEAAARADRCGMFLDPHTAVALAALEKKIADGTVSRESRVVIISTAHGLKFSEFKTGYHNKSLEGIQSRHPNVPRYLSPSVDEVRRVIEEVLG